MPKNECLHSSIAAAWIILGREIVPSWSAWPNTVTEVLAMTGSGKTQAYEVVGRLRGAVSGLFGRPGRPVEGAAEPLQLLKVSRAIQRFLMTHPGAAYQKDQRAHYSDDFRRFIIDLVEADQPGHGLSVAQLADATSVPLGTLKDWFHRDLDPEACAEPAPAGESLKDAHMRQIVTLFQGWKGTFMSFCQTLRQHHRLNYGTTFIGNLLHNTGLRARNPRKSKEPPWGEKTFRGLFPGAQWLAYGTKMAVQGIDVVWSGLQFNFNLEVILDAACNAIVGLSVSDSEDQDALLSAFEDAVSNAGEAALALSADNRPSNHTEVVKQSLGETALLATTPGRGQSKAPLEGTFGLFKQALPEINVAGSEPREQARRVLELVFTAWARGRNGRPRFKLGKKSPAQFYQDSTPTDELLETATQWFQELRRRQEHFRKTKAERADQAKLSLLKQGLNELGIQDADGRLAVNLAYYSRDSIVNGLAIFEAKRRLGTLPPGVDEPRYLGGIIRNEDTRAELELEAELFLRNRQRLRDLSLEVLAAKAALSEGHSPKARFRIFLERALKAERAIDYHFWAAKTHEILVAFDAGLKGEAYDYATRRISTAFCACRDRRIALLSRLSSACTEV